MNFFYESLRGHAKNEIDFEKKKKRLPLVKEELKPNQDAKVCYICRKKIFAKVPLKEKLPKA